MGAFFTKLKECFSCFSCCPSYCHISCCGNVLDMEIENDKQNRDTECNMCGCFTFHRITTNNNNFNNNKLD